MSTTVKTLSTYALTVTCRVFQETMDTGDDGEGGSGSTTGMELARVRRRRRKRRQHALVVNPDENFYFYWLMLVTLCVLYNLWTLIVRQSFPELQELFNDGWIGCDLFTDTVFVLDVCVQFRTGYLEQGLMVYDSRKLAGHYMRSRAFLLDLVSLIPLDLVQFSIGINPMIRFPRFFKVSCPDYSMKFCYSNLQSSSSGPQCVKE